MFSANCEDLLNTGKDMQKCVDMLCQITIESIVQERYLTL